MQPVMLAEFPVVIEYNSHFNVVESAPPWPGSGVFPVPTAPKTPIVLPPVPLIKPIPRQVKLSQALREGGRCFQQCYNIMYADQPILTPDGLSILPRIGVQTPSHACAWGAIMAALYDYDFDSLRGLKGNSLEVTVQQRTGLNVFAPFLGTVNGQSAACASLYSAIIYQNDALHWTFNQIADWLEMNGL